ncbi:hypothetical protein [Streptomyces sp. JJ38]|uniref:hypothetical protein n=1 Tax=Streptomyces sp. JJ38 TaxID=2738128 RepID=UPI001C565CAA|nr:hypothetical protein [Streptomyces sp. JJ38]MBW1600220.1 hypothetical protein [Streptomyces sp. JJ38]
MRLHVDVREGDHATVRYGPYGAWVSHALDERIKAADFSPDDGTERWLDLHQRWQQDMFTVDVPDTEAGALTVADLVRRCRETAHRTHPTPQWDRDAPVIGVWLSDPETDEALPDSVNLTEAGLSDGDVLVLNIEHEPRADYAMGPPPNPAELLRWLQLAENAAAPAGGPRLWGVLLYTDADVELATYVRTHFDDLNVLSGPATRVFVIERRANRSTAKTYWRRHLEPELYRVMSCMHWLRWTPYEPQGAYEIAELLGLRPEHLPCLVFFHSARGPNHTGEKIVFPVEHASTAYFRTLFGGIAEALSPFTGPGARQGPRNQAPTSDYYEYYGAPWETRTYAPAAEAVHTLLTPDASPTPASRADAAAFAALRAAEARLKARLSALVPAAPAPGPSFHNSNVTVLPGNAGAEVSENFHFHGENTTFVNRPQDTVISDFQNNHHAVGAEDFAQLIRLVLASRELSGAERAATVGDIQEVSRLSRDADPDLPAVRTRLERLRDRLALTSDIAQPALALIASLSALFAA